MSSPINKENLEHLASLAHIELSDSEKESFLHDLEKILGHFEELKTLDTSSVPPMSGGTNIMNSFREDTERESTNQGNGKNSFPDSKDEFLKTPSIF